MLRLPSYLLPLSALFATLPAGLPGQVVFGRCLGSDGKPWAEARVTLCAQAVPGFRGLSGDHVLRSTADAEGRFRVEVRPGFVYSAWAVSAPDEAQRCRSSAVVEGVVAGRPLVLRVAHAGPLLTRRIHGLEHWQDAGPLRFVAVVRAENRFEVELPAPQDGLLRFPALPWTKELRLNVFARGGVPVIDDITGHVYRHLARGKLYLPPRVRAWLLVQDASGTKPLPGARVYWNRHGSRQLLGISGKDGMVAIDRTVCQYMDTRSGARRQLAQPHWNLYVACPGYQAGHVMRTKVPVDTPEAVDQAFAKRQAVLHCRMAQGRSQTGQIVARGGRPLGKLQLFAVTNTVTHRGDARIRGRSGGRRMLALQTDAEGRFELEGLPVDRRAGGLLMVCLDAAQQATLGGGGAAMLLPRIRLTLPGAGVAEPVWDLAGLPLLTIRVEAADGGPAVGAECVLRVDYDDEPPQLRVYTDQRGQLSLRAEPAAPLLLGLRHRSGFGFAQLELGAAAKGPIEVPLRLTAPLRLAGRVMQQGGEKPLPGEVSVRCVQVHAPANGQPAGRHAGWTKDGVSLGPVRSSYALDFLLERFHYDTEAGADGAFVAHIPAQPGQYSCEARQNLERRTLYGRAVVDAEPPQVPRAEIEIGKKR